MNIHSFICSVAAGLLLISCVRIPDVHVTVGNDGRKKRVNNNPGCEKLVAVNDDALHRGQPVGLDPHGFTVLNWNSYKGLKKHWNKDLEQLMQPSDVVLLQEGHLTKKLQELLRAHNFNWDIAAAFTYNMNETGVLTAAKVKPDFLCSFREKEPIGSIPKTVLLTRYPLAGTNTSLLVANVHMINFTIELSAFRKQLEKTRQILAQHEGPIILSGDLNTWNGKRMAVVEEIAGKLNLQPVIFDEDHRVNFMGHAVDHIYYRGLVPVASSATEIQSSDHNPMLVTFKLDERTNGT